ncbi:WD40-repeat-containing domain protein [Coprinopsis sp. MPI-PUGE-AT-0042]|nr:WD40-repeat-containing domain protein [Coprinopsis sp. MPI-PUGE-AT-0042]
MLFEVTKKLFAPSDRVKSVDFHPTEPWLLAALYNGTVNIYNHNTGALVKSFEVAEVPVRCAKFIPRKHWFVAGSDDFQLRIFNYNTHEKVAAFEAHPDYIRCLTVHPTLSIVLTGSDDMTIKAWDWEKGWKCIQVYEGHTHYIMSLSFNPKDANTFISACLDRTIKIWSLASSSPNSTLEAHDKGVNYVDFYPGSDKPYLTTCGDDKTVKVYNYLSKSCVQTMEGHTNNVSFAIWLEGMPVIISGSEDGTIKIWNAGTYRVENTLSYGLERAWCVALRKGANEVAVGFDEGVVKPKLYENFKEKTCGAGTGAGSFAVDQIYTDWRDPGMYRRQRGVRWNWHVCGCATDDSYFILRFDRGAYMAQVESGATITDRGVEEAFDAVAEIPNGIKTGNGSATASSTPPPTTGYATLLTRNHTPSAHSIHLSISIPLHTLPLRRRIPNGGGERDISTAEKILEPAQERDYKFDLTLSLDDLDTAANIVRVVSVAEAAVRWKSLGDRALGVWRFDLARESLKAAGDLGSLFLHREIEM